MKSLAIVLTAAALCLGGCLPDKSTAGDVRVDGIAVLPPGEPDLSILNDQRNAAGAKFVPSAAPTSTPKEEDEKPAAPSTAPATTPAETSAPA